MATLGNTNNDTNFLDFDAGYALASVITNNTGSDITISDITFRIYHLGTCSFKGVVWESTGSYNVLATGSSVSTIPAQIGTKYWLSSSASYTMLNNTSYLVGYVSSAVGRSCSTNITYDVYYDNTNSFTTPNTLAKILTYDNRQLCVYVTYGVAPSGPAITVEGLTPASAESVLWASITAIK